MNPFMFIILAFVLKFTVQYCSDDNCLICKDGTHCQVPLEGYYLTQESISIKCPNYRGKNCRFRLDQDPMAFDCLDGFSTRQDGCGDCKNKKCRNCDYRDTRICTSCPTGKYLVNQTQCLSCDIENCYECNQSDFCPPCPSSQFFEGYTYLSDQCLKCNDNNCKYCPFQPQICTECKLSFGLNENSTCDECEVQNCKICSFNSSDCIQCKDGYQLFSNSYVVFCNQCPQNCQNCQNYECLYCKKGFGLNISSGECEPCENQKCQLCSLNKNYCQKCKFPYGLTPEGTCGSCRKPTQQQNILCDCSYNESYCYNCVKGDKSNKVHNGKCRFPCHYGYCLNCDNDYFICKQCAKGHGIHPYRTGHADCPGCWVQRCVQCPESQKKCIQCKTGFHLFANSRCVKCDQDHCLQCPNIDDHCEICDFGFFNNNEGQCVRCPQRCNGCNSFLENQIACVECSELYEQKGKQCVDKCGDQYIIDLQCDKRKGIEFDGCDDECNVQTDFNCTKTNQNKSLCSYAKEIDLAFESFTETKVYNEFTLVVKVFPPLHIFTVMKDEQILRSFAFANSEFVLANAKYDSETQRFFFTVKITEEVTSKAFLLNFVPETEVVEEYFAMPNVTMEKEYDFSDYRVYSSKVFSLVRIIQYLSYIVVILSWISFLLGIILKDPFGVETMWVVQFAFFSFVWADSPFVFNYFSLLPLKYSFGYNYGHFIKENTLKVTEKAPFTSQFEISDQFLINNFSFPFLLMTISAIIVIVFLVLYKMQKRKNTLIEIENQNKNLSKKKSLKKNGSKQQKQTNENINRNDQLLKSKQIKYDFCLQISFHLALISLIPLISLSVILFSQDRINTLNIIFFSISAFLVTLTFLMFYIFPYRFLSLLKHYRMTFFPQRFLYLQIFTIFSATVMLGVFSSLSFLPFIFVGTMIILTIIIRPYLFMKSNIFTILTYITMCILTGFKCYTQKLLKINLSSYGTTSLILVLVLLCLFVAIVSFILHFLHYFNKKNQVQKAKLVSSQEKMHLEVLNNLVQVNVRKKMAKLENNYFKQIIQPKHSVRSLSQQLHIKIRSPDFHRKLSEQSTQNQSSRVQISKPYDFDKLKWEPSSYSIFDDRQELKQMKQNNQSSKIKLLNKNKITIAQNAIKDEYIFIQHRACKDKIKDRHISENFINQYENILDNE